MPLCSDLMYMYGSHGLTVMVAHWVVTGTHWVVMGVMNESEHDSLRSQPSDCWHCAIVSISTDMQPCDSPPFDTSVNTFMDQCMAMHQPQSCVTNGWLNRPTKVKMRQIVTQFWWREDWLSERMHWARSGSCEQIIDAELYNVLFFFYTIVYGNVQCSVNVNDAVVWWSDRRSDCTLPLNRYSPYQSRVSNWHIGKNNIFGVFGPWT